MNSQNPQTPRRWSWSHLIPKNIETLKTEPGPSPGPLTEWAKKYGHSRDPTLATTAQNFTPRKSGLSPQTFTLETLSTLDQAKLDEFDTFELRELSMKLRDFQDLDILEVKGIRGNNLDNEICPVLDKSRWNVVKGEFKMPEVFGDRLWSVHEVPEVWEVLKPICRLASLFLTSPYMVDWWDALAFGPKIPIEPPRAPPSPKLYSFDVRPAEIRTNSQPIPSWKDLAENIAWTFFDGSPTTTKNAGNGDVIYQQAAKSNGMAAFEGNPDKENPYENLEDRIVEIYVSYTMILPLLGNLIESERLVQNFHIATVLIHELSVNILYTQLIL